MSGTVARLALTLFAKQSGSQTETFPTFCGRQLSVGYCEREAGGRRGGEKKKKRALIVEAKAEAEAVTSAGILFGAAVGDPRRPVTR